MSASQQGTPRIRFQKPANQTDEQVAQRVSEIIYGTPDLNTNYNTGDAKWNLGGLNDWWMRVDASGQCTITSRACNTGRMERVADTLRREADPIHALVTTF